MFLTYSPRRTCSDNIVCKQIEFAISIDRLAGALKAYVTLSTFYVTLSGLTLGLTLGLGLGFRGDSR